MKPGTIRYVGIALKVAIVLLAGFYIARKILAGNFLTVFEQSFTLLQILPVFLLMPVNWILEARKWQLLASLETKITLRQALQSVLAGVTTGTSSPNRVGEFAGRIFSIKNGDRISLLLLSSVASICQVAITLFFGFVALVFMLNRGTLLSEYISRKETIWALGLGLILVIGTILILKNKKVKQVLTLVSPPLISKLLLLSFLRYAVYVLQFVLLILPYLDHASPMEAVLGICICYLLVTIIPTFSITELLVRGTVAGIILWDSLDLVGANEASATAVLLWLINVGIPSLMGMFFIPRLRFWIQRKSDKE
jgi:hypothetical protein